MAGEIQIGGTTFATESGGTVTVSNVDSAANRTNLGLGSIATQAADSVSISGGNITGGTIGSGVVFPAGHIIKVNYYTISSGTLTNSSFPADNTIPQITEGTEVWSQSITPSSDANYLLIQAHVKLNETASLSNEMALGLFISDATDALVVSQGLNERTSGGGPFNDFPAYINYRMASWSGAKTLSLRSSGAQAYNYFDQYGSYSSGSYYGGSITSSVIIWEIV